MIIQRIAFAIRSLNAIDLNHKSHYAKSGFLLRFVYPYIMRSMNMKKRSFFRKKLVILTGILFLTFSSIYLTLEPIYTPTAFATPNQKLILPQFIAHKSLVSQQYRGDTKEALEQALTSPVEGIELDVRLSQDKVPFIFHADQLEETTRASGRPEDKTWAELEKIHYLPLQSRESEVSQKYQAEPSSPLMSLEEVFKRVGSSKYLFLDIKEKGILDNGFAGALAALIEKYQLYDTVIVESLNPIFLTWVRLTTRDIMIMYDFVTNTEAQGEELQSQFDQIPWLLRQPFVQKQFRRILRPDLLGPRWNIDKSLMQALVQHGYPVIAWTVDDLDVAKKLFILGIQGIQTNRPLNLETDFNVSAQKLSDAGGTEVLVNKRIYITHIQQIIDTLAEAKKNKLHISIAGRRHSMGGQALLNGSLQLDMLGLNKISYDPQTKRVKAEAGATWKKIQKLLNQYGRSITIMQSDNIFTVGGSVSVNVHGWQTGMPPLGSTIHAMKVLTMDGKIREISLQKDPELFKSVIGGYGQFAIILEVELNTHPNSLLQYHALYFPSNQFETQFKNIVENHANIELAYGRLSIDKDHFLTEAGLFWYEKISELPQISMQAERFIAIKRAIFRASEYSDLGKKLRWNLEKSFSQQFSNETLSRNTAMSPDVHLLWPIRQGYRDILQEYFIPKGKMNNFIESLKKSVDGHDVNLLNVTIREVKKDNISELPYANQDSFAFVLLFSQADDANGESVMKAFTQDLTERVLALSGTFYLPYRMHYTRKEILQAYPMIQNWIKLKNKWDPQYILSSDFYMKISALAKITP